MTAVASLFRYPIKGLSGDMLQETTLKPGKGVPHDRQFALALGDTDFDPKNPVHLSKRKFLMLMQDAKLAELKTCYNAAEMRLTIMRDSETVFSGALNEKADIDALGTFFDAFMDGKTRGGARLVSAKGHMFADIPDQNVSLINLSSVEDFEEQSGLAVDWKRFRGNIYLEGMAPWAELDLVDKEFQIGEAIFRGTERTGRCAAVNVNLDTAERDMNIPLSLKKLYGHSDMGIYADVVKGGILKTGDTMKVL